jgi:hypothetical protein
VIKGMLSYNCQGKKVKRKCLAVTANNAFERTAGHRCRAVLAINCVLGGAEWAPYQAAQLGR